MDAKGTHLPTAEPPLCDRQRTDPLIPHGLRNAALVSPDNLTARTGKIGVRRTVLDGLAQGPV
ncbi:MAG: hypothetical protein ABIP94_12395, partial [Planctomycetota bacterium]